MTTLADSQTEAGHRKTRGRARKSLELIDAAIRILDEIQPATVRAICYRLFVAKMIPSMEKTNTNKVSRLLVHAREAGDLPWEWIVDETREAERIITWDDPKALFNACVRQYRRDYWADQPKWIEVWSEKGTVRGTLASVLNDYGITFRVMHGYGSATVVNDVAEMTRNADKPLTVLYVGDRDPSGMHMSEIDLPDRLDRYGGDVEIIRVAIDHMDTLDAAAVPWFPASDKTGDRRHAWYVANFGTKCWELDALSPVLLRDRIEDEIVARIDMDAWEHSKRIEKAEHDSLTDYLRRYPGIPGQATK